MLKTSEVSRVRSTNEHFDVFNSRDEIYLVFTEKSKVPFLFYTFYRLHVMSHPLKKAVLKMQKKKPQKNEKKLANPNNFGIKMLVTF